MKIFNKICSIFSTIIILILLLLAVTLVLPNLLKWKNLAVLSGSMEPEIPVGSMVCIQPVDPAEIEVGDVITYRISSDTMVTHRVISIDPQAGELITKGDANETEDGSPVPFDHVVGKLKYHVPYLGYVTIYAKTPQGIMVICGVVIVLILLNFLPSVLSEDEAEKKQKKDKTV